MAYPPLVDTSTTRHTVAKNLNALMAHHLDLDSNPKLSKRSKVGLGTVSRMRTAAVDVTIDTLEKVAFAFDLQAWQLLVPDLSPQDPPMLRDIPPAEEELYRRLRAAIKSADIG